MRKITEKNRAREKASTRQLIGARAVTDYSLVTYGQGELVYFMVGHRTFPSCPKPV